MKILKTFTFLAISCFIFSCSEKEDTINYEKLKISVNSTKINLNKGDSCMLSFVTNDSSKVGVEWQLKGNGQLTKDGYYFAPTQLQNDFEEEVLIAKVKGHNEIFDSVKIKVFNDVVNTFQNSFSLADHKELSYINESSVIELSHDRYIFSIGNIWSYDSYGYVALFDSKNGISTQLLNGNRYGGVIGQVKLSPNEVYYAGYYYNDKSKEWNSMVIRSDSFQNLNYNKSNIDGEYLSICKGKNEFLALGTKVESNAEHFFIEKPLIPSLPSIPWRKYFNLRFEDILINVDSSKYACLHHNLTYEVDELCLLFISSDGDSITTKKIADCKIPYFRIINNNNELIITSIDRDSAGREQLLLVKTDLEGNILLKKLIDVFPDLGDYNRFHDIKIINNRLFLYTQGKNFVSYEIGPQGEIKNKFINNCFGNISSITPTSNGGLLIISKVKDKVIFTKTDKFGNLRNN